MRAAVDRQLAWRALSDQAASLTQQPAPTVIHFARFEQPFLRTLGTGFFPLDVVCTHDIARRLLPNLPRCSLRALAGYFGRAVGALRRSADHVEATAFVWQELVRLLETKGVSTWSALHDWLAAPVEPTRCRRRVWPMPRDVRLSLPHAPGIYRMLRTDGSVLYVGKAASLHDRVNSYFRKQNGVPERLLEMLSQARAISFDIHPVRSRPRSSSRTKSSGTDRPTTSRSRFMTGRCGLRRQISVRVAQSRHHTARSAHLLRPRRSINSWHSLGETALR